MEQVKLGAAKSTHARTEQRDRAKEHQEALRQAIAEEAGLPTVEQNQPLLRSLRVQEATLAQHQASVEHASSAPVIEQELKMQIHPIEEHLHALTGSNLHVGTAGELGEVTKQIKTLRTGAEGLSTAHEQTELSVLPKLHLALERLVSQLGEQPVQPAKPTVAAGEPQSELAGLYKERAEHEALTVSVSQAQYKVLEQFLKTPFGGHFAEGGVVPGPPGSPKIIEAHGGETVHKADAPLQR